MEEVACPVLGLAVQKRHFPERVGRCCQRFGIPGATCDSGEPLRAGTGRGLSSATGQERCRPAERGDGVVAVLAPSRELEEQKAARFGRRVLGLLFIEACQPPGAVQSHDHELGLLGERERFSQRRSSPLRIPAEHVHQPELADGSAAGVAGRLVRGDHIAADLDDAVPLSGLPQDIGEAAEADLRPTGDAMGFAEI